MSENQRFSYTKDEDGTYTISGATYSLPGGKLQWDYIITLDSGATDYISNNDLSLICELYFPEIEADPESDMFFGYAETEEDAQAFCRFMNDVKHACTEFKKLIEELP